MFSILEAEEKKKETIAFSDEQNQALTAVKEGK